MADLFDAFETSKGGTLSTVPVCVRVGVPAAEREVLARALDAVPWDRLHDACGPAVDVPVHLYAAALGEPDTRAAAW